MDDTTSSDIPPVLDLFTSGPYVFGSRYVGLLRQAGGQGRVNDAFTFPPSTEEEIIDPVAARAGEPGKRWRRRSCAPASKRSGKPDEFGAWSLYLVLASRLDPELSLHAAEGWGGDRYVGFTQRGTDGQECLRISVIGDIAPTPTSSPTRSAAGGGAPRRCRDVTAGRRSRRGHRVRHRFADRRRRGHARSRRHPAGRPQRHRTRACARKAPPRIARCAADRLAADPTLVALLDEQKFTPEQEDQFTGLVTSVIRLPDHLTRADSVAEVRELEGDVEVGFAEPDRSLEVVPLLAAHAELLSLNLVGDALEAESLMNLPISLAFTSETPTLRVAVWRTVPLAASSTLPYESAFNDTLRRTSFSSSTCVSAGGGPRSPCATRSTFTEVDGAVGVLEVVAVRDLAAPGPRRCGPLAGRLRKRRRTSA